MCSVFTTCGPNAQEPLRYRSKPQREQNGSDAPESRKRFDPLGDTWRISKRSTRQGLQTFDARASKLCKAQLLDLCTTKVRKWCLFGYDSAKICFYIGFRRFNDHYQSRGGG